MACGTHIGSQVFQGPNVWIHVRWKMEEVVEANFEAFQRSGC